MANITPEEFIKTYSGGSPEKFNELMDAYSAYIGDCYDRFKKESEEDFNLDLLNGELSFEKFMMALWKDGQDV
jgi:hypothetical protein